MVRMSHDTLPVSYFGVRIDIGAFAIDSRDRLSGPKCPENH
jgi:hypothetical protein